MKNKFYKRTFQQKVKLEREDIVRILQEASTMNEEEREVLLSRVYLGNKKLIDLIPAGFFDDGGVSND